MIQFKNINLSFSQPFFKDLNLSLEKGKLHSVTGKNGAGKSTFFSAIRGASNNSYTVAGEICFGNEIYSLKNSQALQKTVGYVPQAFDTVIADQFSFPENLRFARLNCHPSLFKGLPLLPDLPPFIDRFGIPPDLPAKQLSGGQRQILALLMAIQKNPQLMLLDEPTATLDPTNSRMVFEFIHQLIALRRFTALVICHDHPLIAEFRTGSSFELYTTQGGIRRITVN